MNSPEPSVRDIALMLKDHTEPLARMIFPAAVKAGGFLCVGSINGEAGMSLKIRLTGPKKGTWVDYSCSPNDQAGMGDMLKLVQLTLGNGNLGAGVREAKRYLNLDSMDPRAMERMQERARKATERSERQKAKDDERKRRDAAGLWGGAAQLTASSPVVQYLSGRSIDLRQLGKLPGAIRFAHRVYHAELSAKRGARAYLPAMVTKYCLISGQHGATHITYLERTRDGWGKLSPFMVEDVDPQSGEVIQKQVAAAKKSLCPLYWGAHIPLWKGRHRCKLADIPAGTTIYVSEGIEDGLSFALANPDARVLAAGTLGNIGAMQLPPQAGDLVVLAQNDTNPKPIAALADAVQAQQLQARQQGSSRQVVLKRPPAGIKDWNDWLKGETA